MNTSRSIWGMTNIRAASRKVNIISQLAGEVSAMREE